MKKNNSNAASGGIGFVGLLQLTFIVLKLCKVITWKWWLVLLPSIISAGLVVLLFIVTIVFSYLASVDKL